LCEIESAHDAATTPGYDVANRGWLAAVMCVLRGSGAMLPVAISPHSWNLVAGHTKERRAKLPSMTDTVLLEDYRVRFILSNHTKRNDVTEEDAMWVRENFDAFNTLAASLQPFRFGLEASFDWRYAHDQRAAIARLWSGIEALLNISTEITYRLSITAASLLARRGEDRLKRYKSIKALYGLRSKAVHGTDISEADLLRGLDGAFELLRDLVIATASNGHVFTSEEIDQAILVR
jgi:hypothetical protein